MFTLQRALTRNSDSGKPLPKIAAFRDLYGLKCTPRHGEVVMIVGRSGTQKSGLALFWADEMNLPTLYFSADMSAFTASMRLASKRTGLTTEELELIFASGSSVEQQSVLDAVADSQVRFSFGSPITWQQVDDELSAWVAMHNSYPAVICIDNLMDVDGAEADYQAQMEVMQTASDLARDTGATVLLMHHASDKSWEAKTDPWQPPSRDQVKGGLSEKPELSLSVALDPHTLQYRIAVIKQRMGPCDPTARTYAVLRCEPEFTRFHSV